MSATFIVSWSPWTKMFLKNNSSKYLHSVFYNWIYKIHLVSSRWFQLSYFRSQFFDSRHLIWSHVLLLKEPHLLLQGMVCVFQFWILWPVRSDLVKWPSQSGRLQVSCPSADQLLWRWTCPSSSFGPRGPLFCLGLCPSVSAVVPVLSQPSMFVCSPQINLLMARVQAHQR